MYVTLIGIMLHIIMLTYVYYVALLLQPRTCMHARTHAAQPPARASICVVCTENEYAQPQATENATTPCLPNIMVKHRSLHPTTKQP